MKLKILDLFSGLGGFSLGLERTGHFETVAFCDNNKYSKLVIDKHWKGIKIYDDIREITKEKFTTDGIETPDIITGGFPCQPFSVAGKQKGTSDDRHLWPEMFRIIKTFKPRFIIGENVRGIVNIQDGMVFETVCTDLEDEGYEVQPFNIPAAGVGAPHRRERIWFIAIREESMVNSDNIRFEQHSTTKEETSWRGTSATFEPTSSTNVVNSEHIGSSTSEIEGSFTTSSNNNEERQNETIKFKGTSGSSNSINVADTNDEGIRTRIGGSDNDHATESRIGGADGERGTRDVERHNSTSTKVKGMDVADTNESRSGERKVSRDIGDEGRRASETRGESIQPKDRQTRTDNIGSSNSNVADTESIGSDVGRRSEHSETWNGQREIGRENSQDDANTDTERLQGFRESSSQLDERFSTRSESSEGGQGTVGEGWWSVEPNVGRVAHGVPGRVHRLKGLGNSIVPQIVEEIGKALIKAEGTTPF